MRTTNRSHKKPILSGYVLGPAFFVAASTLMAADTNAPPALTPQQAFEGGTNAYANWIDFTAGGFVIDGNKARFEQQHQVSGGAFGGIQDLHYTTNLTTNITMTVDGHAIVDENNYQLKLGVQSENKGYLRFTYDEYRTWWDGDGGFFSPTAMNYPLSPNALGLDRANFSLEAGLTPEKGINAIFNYTHTSRDGDQDSTRWGDVHPANSTLAQGLSPSFETIHEHTDSIQLDLSDHVKATQMGLGLHLEKGELDDSLKITEFPGEPVQQKITDQQGTKYDDFDVTTFTETWVRTNLLVSTGFAYSLLDNTFSGSRIYGSDFDVGYVPNAQYGIGYYGLGGGSQMQDYVMDVNLLYKLTEALTITPSLRVEKDDWAANSSGIETQGAGGVIPFSSDSDSGDIDVRSRLDLIYRGFTNWVLDARVDLTEVEGNLDQDGGLLPIGGIGIPPVESGIYDRNFVQKYSLGARWYPLPRLTLDAGGYYKLDVYHYSDSPDSTPNNSALRYPGYLEMQDFETYDASLRFTYRPLNNLSLISRYEYQWSTIDTEPDPTAGLPNVESSAMRSHIIAQDVTWTPWSRLSLQTGFNYVLSATWTPASEVTQAILNSENNYWTINVSSTFVVDNKTDLTVSYFYYDADDYADNSPEGVPYGAGGQEHCVTATLTRKISERIRMSLKYGYFRYLDAPSGGNANFGANMIYATLRYRF